MCNVCVAEQALYVASCGKAKCPAMERGFEVLWDEGPSLRLDQENPKLARRVRALDKKMMSSGHKRKAPLADNVNKAHPRVFVRAHGLSSEFRPARYQLRLQNDQWPKKWVKTKDLAGSLGHYGLDVRWKWVPKAVKDWTLRKHKMPTEAELLRELKKRQPKPLTEFGKQRVRKRYERQGYRRLGPKEKMKVGWIYNFVRGTDETWGKPVKSNKRRSRKKCN